MTAKSKTKSKAPAKSAKASTPEVGYGGHLPGRRKGKVHEVFDNQGSETAWTLGLKLHLRPGTLRAWFSTWKRLQAKPKTTAKSKGTDKVKTNSATAPAGKAEAAVAA